MPPLQTTPAHSATKSATPLAAATISLPLKPRSLSPTAALPLAATPTSVSVADGSSITIVLPFAEQMPTFTRGKLALHRYLAANTMYPTEAVRAGLSGKVVLQGVINEQGRALNPVVVKSSNTVFNAETTRLT